MNSLAIIIPVKSFGAKSRLSGVLSAAQRRQFTRILLTDLLDALAGAGVLGSTHVVTSDGELARFASSLGAGEIRETRDQGVNSAVLRGVKEAGSPDTVVVIPSDLPLIRPTDVKRVLRLRSYGVDVVITPSLGFNGTNALAFPADSDFALSYDNDSFWNHLASAARNGLTTAVCCRPGIMFDVDSPEDFKALADTRVDRPSADFARRHSS